MKNRLLPAIPFLIISLIVLYTWFEIITTDYMATWRHYVALTLVAINAVLYFVRYKPAILLTGLILILATFNLLSFFSITQTAGLTIMGVSSPEIQLKSLLMLVIYCAINYYLLINWYLDMKEEKAKTQKTS
ncbi:hypothetical protein ACX0G9_25920 [Flavitalea flava]